MTAPNCSYRDERMYQVALEVSRANSLYDIIHSMAALLGADMAYVGRILDPDVSTVETVVLCDRGVKLDNQRYSLDNTPCERVVGQQFRFVETGLATCYPGDNMIQTQGFDAYAGFPLYTPRGQPLGLIAALHRGPMTDPAFAQAVMEMFGSRVTNELQRLRTIAALETSEEQYRSIFNAAIDGMVIWDLGGRVVAGNPAASGVLGFSLEEMTQMRARDAVAPRSQADWEQFFGEVTAGRKSHLDAWARRKDGTEVPLEVDASYIEYLGAPHLLTIFRDISDRKARELALRHSEERLRQTVDVSLDSIITIDSDGAVIDFNTAAERCFGFRRADVLGKSLAELIIPPRYRERHREGMERVQHGGEGKVLGQRIEVTALRASGEEFAAELAVVASRAEQGNIYIGYLRDITEQKQAEQQRVLLEAQLRQAQKMEAIGHLAGGIAHDFNNLLTALNGYVVMAAERLRARGDAQIAGYLEKAQQSGQKARDLIQQLLTFSRGQRGEPRPVVLNDLLRDNLDLLSSSLPSSISFNAELEQPVPPLLLDPVHMEQVAMNLCINARDAVGQHGRVQLGVTEATLDNEICTSCHQPVNGRFVELRVQDDGEGIRPEVLDRIFEPFFSTKATGRGSGMGLATVHGIVHDYQGHIVVDSLPGLGASFRVLLPWRPVAADDIAITVATEPARETAFALAGRVLLVDDATAVNEFMQEMLTSWQLDVVAHVHPHAALAAFEAEPGSFDLAIIDYTMPDMDGLALADRLLKLRPELPVVLYTGYAEKLSDEKVQAHGVRALVRKPIAPNHLRSQLADLLRLSRHREG